METHFQYNKDGLIFASVTSNKPPKCDRQIKSTRHLMGKVYHNGSVYHPVLDEDGKHKKSGGKLLRGSKIE